MTKSATGSVRLPVNAKGLKERMLVNAALMDHDAQLRNFTPLRDRLVVSGQDANAKYREIESQRDQLLAERKRLTPTASPPSSPALPGSSALSLPIAPITLLGPGLGPWFGFSGSVLMGPAQEGENEIPPDVLGSIDTSPNGLLLNGSVLFTGDIQTSGRPATWLHTWHYLIVFPTPVRTSVLTYSFGVGVLVSLFGGKGGGTFLSFLSLGETADFTGQEIMVHNDGYPLVTNFQAITTSGSLNVRRSFVVDFCKVPAIALVVGVATVLQPDSEVQFSDEPSCFICPAASIDPTTAVGPIAERGVVNFHYQPVPLAT